MLQKKTSGSPGIVTLSLIWQMNDNYNDTKTIVT